jgi:hypothetical protein
MPDKLSDLIPSSLGKGNSGRTVRAAMVAAVVEKAIAAAVPSAAGKVRCVKVKDGTAHVRATTSVLAEEVRLHEADILAAIGDEGAVARIRLVA